MAARPAYKAKFNDLKKAVKRLADLTPALNTDNMSQDDTRAYAEAWEAVEKEIA